MKGIVTAGAVGLLAAMGVLVVVGAARVLAEAAANLIAIVNGAL